MENSIITICGKVEAVVYDKDGNELSKSVSHNIVTSSGDSLIADMLQLVPVRQKIDSTHGYLPVGTGWTGTLPKANTWVNTQTGIAQVLDTGYPQLLAAWGGSATPASNSNVVVYRVTYTQGSLNVSGINEAAITSDLNSGSSVNCLAYSQITPSVNVTTLDSLVVTWQITFLGS